MKSVWFVLMVMSHSCRKIIKSHHTWEKIVFGFRYLYLKSLKTSPKCCVIWNEVLKQMKRCLLDSPSVPVSVSPVCISSGNTSPMCSSQLYPLSLYSRWAKQPSVSLSHTLIPHFLSLLSPSSSSSLKSIQHFF